MEALAERPTVDINLERYGRSLSTLRRVGAAALKDSMELGRTPEYEMARANTFTAVVEMIGTDKTSPELLDIDPEDTYTIINGQACDKDGTPMLDKVINGERKSAALTAEDHRFIFQNVRDRGDVHVAEVNDRLNDSWSHIAISMKPIEAMELHPEVYKDELGYSDLVYVQRYSKSGDVMTSAAHSIMVKDVEAFKQELAAHGFEIPQDELSDKWILHGNTYEMTAEQAEAFSKNIRNSYYARVGESGVRKSATEYVQDNIGKFDTLFDSYYPALSKAVFTGENNRTLQELAQAMLQTDLNRMKEKFKNSLAKLATAEDFDDELGVDTETIIRYAIVEILRKDLVSQKTSKPQISYTQGKMNWSANTYTASSTIPAANPSYTNQLMAQNLSSGVREGRDYGGCPGQVRLTVGDDMEWGSDDIFSSNTAGNHQWTYGGKSRSSKLDADELGNCEFISKKCPECGAKDVKTVSTKTHISGSCGCRKAKH